MLMKTLEMLRQFADPVLIKIWAIKYTFASNLNIAKLTKCVIKQGMSNINQVD